MQTTGTLLEIFPPVTGEGKNGTWKKQDILLEIGDQYKKKLCVTVWGDKIDLNQFQPNEALTVHLDLESRQYQEKWYSDIKAWKVERTGASSPTTTSPTTTGATKTNTPPEDFLLPTVDDDLPF